MFASLHFIVITIIWSYGRPRRRRHHHRQQLLLAHNSQLQQQQFQQQKCWRSTSLKERVTRGISVDERRAAAVGSDVVNLYFFSIQTTKQPFTRGKLSNPCRTCRNGR